MLQPRMAENVCHCQFNADLASLTHDLHCCDRVASEPEETVVQPNGGRINVEHLSPYRLHLPLYLCRWLPFHSLSAVCISASCWTENDPPISRSRFRSVFPVAVMGSSRMEKNTVGTI